MPKLAKAHKVLLVPEKPKPSPLVWVKKFYPIDKVVVLPDGRRARIHINEQRNVKHTESDNTLDCLVVPESIRLQLRAVRDGDPRSDNG